MKSGQFPGKVSSWYWHSKELWNESKQRASSAEPQEKISNGEICETKQSGKGTFSELFQTELEKSEEKQVISPGHVLADGQFIWSHSYLS